MGSESLAATAALLPSDIDDAVRRAQSRLGAFGRAIRWFDEVDSTNDIAAALAMDGAAEGHVVAAGAQRRGRGRLGRAWASPAGAGVYASVLLRPPAHALPLLTLAAGLAIAEGVRAASGLEAGLKWPNDLYVVAGGGGGRKLAGILAEAGAGPTDATHVVLGFGVNVTVAAYPPELRDRATSIEAELGRSVDRGLVLAECLAALWSRYADLRENRRQAVLDAWRPRAAWTFGRPVEWEEAGAIASGIAVGVDDHGALVVRTRGGERRLTASVRWGPAS